MNFKESFVAFIGENGAGKTNILEALSLFSSGRGLRKAPTSDLNNISTLPNSWNVEIAVDNGNRFFLETNANSGKRSAKIDGVSVNSLGKFEDIIWLLWIVPSMNNIFIGDVSERRKFFDHLVSGFDKTYKARLKTIKTLQKERLHILFYRKDKAWLDILEHKIAEESIAVTNTRWHFINLLHENFSFYASNFLRPKISLCGMVEQIYSDNNEETAVLDLMEKLAENRLLDTEKQTTHVGIFRSFWEVMHCDTNLEASNCSTGEQKAFLISLILAVLRIYKQSRIGIPILLLDDLMVHLDHKNRRYLVHELQNIGAQTFFTGTDKYLFNDIKNASQIFTVENSICQEDRL